MELVSIFKARLALRFTYDHKNIVPYGPMIMHAVKQNNRIIFPLNTLIN